MASNGIEKRAATGTCRMCLRRRSTEKHVKEVGEVRHGYATGYIWECIDHDECDKEMERRLNDPRFDEIKKYMINNSKKNGRLTGWLVRTASRSYYLSLSGV